MSEPLDVDDRHTRATLDSTAPDQGTTITRMDDEALLSSFGAWQSGRAFSVHTVRRRTVSIGKFRAFIAPARLDTATPSLVEEWVGTHRAPRTRHAYRSDVSAFYRWAQRRGLVIANPVDGTDSIRVPKGLPRPVDTALIPGIIGAATDPDLRLMIALAAYAGLRRAEIAALATDDVSLHTVPPMIAVRSGKGGKDRLVPLHPVLAGMMSDARVAGSFFAVSPATVGRRVADHLTACGVDATCHQLRHSFGTELARVTRGNIPLVRTLMGHLDLNTTIGYIGWTGEGSGEVSEMYRP